MSQLEAEYRLKKAKEMTYRTPNELWFDVLDDMSQGDDVNYGRGELVIIRLLIELIKKVG
jgi:hypothetical protein